MLASYCSSHRGITLLCIPMFTVKQNTIHEPVLHIIMSAMHGLNTCKVSATRQYYHICQHRIVVHYDPPV